MSSSPYPLESRITSPSRPSLAKSMASDRGSRRRGSGPTLPPINKSYPELQHLPGIASGLARDIADLPVVRPLLLRYGFELGNSLRDPRRPWNLEVSLAFMRGEVVSDACKHCLKTQGPFKECVILPGYFQGACTNCEYNDHGERCTFRRTGTSICISLSNLA